MAAGAVVVGGIVVGAEVVGPAVVGGSTLVVGAADDDTTPDEDGVGTMGEDDGMEVSVLTLEGTTEVTMTPEEDNTDDTPVATAVSELDISNALVAKDVEVVVIDDSVDDAMVVKPSVAKPVVSVYVEKSPEV